MLHIGGCSLLFQNLISKFVPAENLLRLLFGLTESNCVNTFSAAFNSFRQLMFCLVVITEYATYVSNTCFHFSSIQIMNCQKCVQSSPLCSHSVIKLRRRLLRRWMTKAAYVINNTTRLKRVCIIKTVFFQFHQFLLLYTSTFTLTQQKQLLRWGFSFLQLDSSFLILDVMIKAQ